MFARRHLLLLIPALALCATLGASVRAHAQDASLQVSFGHSPRWVAVPGTHVREIRTQDRPDYDMFRYGHSYYAYRNNQWYMSRHDRGRFTVVEEQRVPVEISKVPRDHWHTYPSDWDHDNDHH